MVLSLSITKQNKISQPTKRNCRPQRLRQIKRHRCYKMDTWRAEPKTIESRRNGAAHIKRQRIFKTTGNG